MSWFCWWLLLLFVIQSQSRPLPITWKKTMEREEDFGSVLHSDHGKEMATGESQPVLSAHLGFQPVHSRTQKQEHLLKRHGDDTIMTRQRRTLNLEKTGSKKKRYLDSDIDLDLENSIYELNQYNYENKVSYIDGQPEVLKQTVDANVGTIGGHTKNVGINVKANVNLNVRHSSGAVVNGPQQNIQGGFNGNQIQYNYNQQDGLYNLQTQNQETYPENIQQPENRQSLDQDGLYMPSPEEKSLAPREEKQYTPDENKQKSKHAYYPQYKSDSSEVKAKTESEIGKGAVVKKDDVEDHKENNKDNVENNTVNDEEDDIEENGENAVEDNKENGEDAVEDNKENDEAVEKDSKEEDVDLSKEAAAASEKDNDEIVEQKKQFKNSLLRMIERKLEGNKDGGNDPKTVQKQTEGIKDEEIKEHVEVSSLKKNDKTESKNKVIEKSVMTVSKKTNENSEGNTKGAKDHLSKEAAADSENDNDEIVEEKKKIQDSLLRMIQRKLEGNKDGGNYPTTVEKQTEVNKDEEIKEHVEESSLTKNDKTESKNKVTEKSVMTVSKKTNENSEGNTKGAKNHLSKEAAADSEKDNDEIVEQKKKIQDSLLRMIERKLEENKDGGNYPKTVEKQTEETNDEEIKEHVEESSLTKNDKTESKNKVTEKSVMTVSKKTNENSEGNTKGAKDLKILQEKTEETKDEETNESDSDSSEKEKVLKHSVVTIKKETDENDTPGSEENNDESVTEQVPSDY